MKTIYNFASPRTPQSWDNKFFRILIERFGRPDSPWTLPCQNWTKSLGSVASAQYAQPSVDCYFTTTGKVNVIQSFSNFVWDYSWNWFKIRVALPRISMANLVKKEFILKHGNTPLPDLVLHRLAKKFLSEKDCLALALSGVSKRFAELFGTNRYKAAIQNASLLQVMTLLFYFILQEVSYQPVPTTQTEWLE